MKNKTNILKLTDEEVMVLKRIRNHFGEDDAEIYKQVFFTILDDLIKRIKKSTEK